MLKVYKNDTPLYCFDTVIKYLNLLDLKHYYLNYKLL